MKKEYSSPEIKVMEVRGQAVLCQSGSAEGFGMSGRTYDDNDFE